MGGLGDLIYLDYNATTPIAPAVVEEMLPYLGTHFGNPSSIHAPGREARAALDNARDRLAKIIGAKPHELIFTSGGTESDNLAVIGLARQLRSHGNHLISVPTEHHAVLQAFEYLEKSEGFRVTWLPVDGTGQIDLDQLSEVITPETTLVSIMSANNETGTLQPITKIAEICRERGVLFHSDMVQSFGKIPLDVRSAGPDAISIAAHKFYGPKGAGLLWLRAGIAIQKIQFGGFHENERRAGTENVAAIAGMGKAAELVTRDIEVEQPREAGLRDRLWSGILAIFPEAILNGHPTERLANTLNVSFPEIDGESLLINLDLEGVCASSGSACMVGSVMPSHVLLAMGASPDLAKSTVRFSLGKGTTADEIDGAIVGMRRIFARLMADAV